MFSSITNRLRWYGAFSIIIGVVTVAWPGVTVGAFVILFALYAFMGAAVEAMHAFSGDRAGPVAGHLLLSVLSVAAGIVALVWPGITALTLTLLIAAWALVTGVAEIAVAFRHDEIADRRAVWALGGLVSIALGVVLAIRPDIGALTLATVFGLFSIFAGVQAFVVSTSIHPTVAAEPVSTEQ